MDSSTRFPLLPRIVLPELDLRAPFPPSSLTPRELGDITVLSDSACPELPPTQSNSLVAAPLTRPNTARTVIGEDKSGLQDKQSPDLYSDATKYLAKVGNVWEVSERAESPRNPADEDSLVQTADLYGSLQPEVFRLDEGDSDEERDGPVCAVRREVALFSEAVDSITGKQETWSEESCSPIPSTPEPPFTFSGLGDNLVTVAVSLVNQVFKEEDVNVEDAFLTRCSPRKTPPAFCSTHASPASCTTHASSPTPSTTAPRVLLGQLERERQDVEIFRIQRDLEDAQVSPPSFAGQSPLMSLLDFPYELGPPHHNVGSDAASETDWEREAQPSQATSSRTYGATPVARDEAWSNWHEGVRRARRKRRKDDECCCQ